MSQQALWAMKEAGDKLQLDDRAVRWHRVVPTLDVDDFAEPPPTTRTWFKFVAYVADINIDIATNTIVGTLTLQRSGRVTRTGRSNGSLVQWGGPGVPFAVAFPPPRPSRTTARWTRTSSSSPTCTRGARSRIRRRHEGNPVFRQLNAGEFRRFQHAERSDDDATAKFFAMQRLIGASLCDEKGKLVLTDQDCIGLTVAGVKALFPHVTAVAGIGAATKSIAERGGGVPTHPALALGKTLGEVDQMPAADLMSLARVLPALSVRRSASIPSACRAGCQRVRGRHQKGSLRWLSLTRPTLCSMAGSNPT